MKTRNIRVPVIKLMFKEKCFLLKLYSVSLLSLPPNLSTLEYVALTMTLEHQCRGALEISLQSPTGTWSKLASSRKHDKSVQGC